MKLSATAVKSAKAAEKPYKLTDGGGLYLLVQPTGSRLWRYDYRFDGKRRTAALGRFPAVGLSDARDRHAEAREQIAHGIDPSEARKAKPHDKRLEPIAREWHAGRKPGWSARYADTVINRLERNIFPELGHRPVDEIATADLMAVLRKVEGRGAVEAARRIKNYLSEIFGFAKASNLLDTDPTAAIDKGRLLKSKPPKKRRAALRATDLPQFLVKAADADLEDDTRDALRFTLLTAVRTVETRFAAAEEFEDLDGSAPLWRISAARMKMKNEHLIPLSRQAAAMARKLVRRVGGKGLLFPRRTVSGTLSENTLLYALYRMGYHSRATVHGFRGTFSTWGNEGGWNKDWIERQLAHVDQDEIRGAYNAAEYLPGRRKLLQRWADYLDEQEEIGRLIG